MTGVTNRVADAITLNCRPRPIDRASGGFSWASYRGFGETRAATKTPRASASEGSGLEILRPDCRGWPGKMNFPDPEHWPWPALALPVSCRIWRNPSTAAIFGPARNRFGQSDRRFLPGCRMVNQRKPFEPLTYRRIKPNSNSLQVEQIGYSPLAPTDRSIRSRRFGSGTLIPRWGDLRY